MREGFGEGGFFFALILFGEEGGVVLHFGEEISGGAVRSVKEGRLQWSTSGSKERFMDLGVGEADLFAVVEAGDPFGIPAAAADAFSVVVVVAADCVGGSGSESVELFDEGRGEDLIAIEAQDPVVAGKRGEMVAQRAKADEGRGVDFDVGISFGDCESVIG